MNNLEFDKIFPRRDTPGTLFEAGDLDKMRPKNFYE
jgi:hypothetical protein